MSIAAEFKNISHSFTGPRVLTNVSLSIKKGQIFGLLGPNGGGKTTLFRILSTLLKPESGEAEIFGHSTHQNPKQVREKVGIVFQSPSLDRYLTVKENLICHGNLCGLKGKDLENRIESLLKHFSLSDRASDLVDHLSGGLKRRVEIAKGILHKPELLIMDEPSTGLDPRARRELWNVLNQLKQDGMTIIMTTHLMEEADLCDQLGIINKGKMVAVGTPVDLKGKIGGDVISIQTKEPENLMKKIQDKFNDQGRIIENTIRIERTNGASFIPQLTESFPGLIDSISVGKPGLEDVFIHMTGEDFNHN